MNFFGNINGYFIPGLNYNFSFIPDLKLPFRLGKRSKNQTAIYYYEDCFFHWNKKRITIIVILILNDFKSLFFLWCLYSPLFCHFFQSFLEIRFLNRFLFIYQHLCPDFILINKIPNQIGLPDCNYVGKEIIVAQSWRIAVQNKQKHNRH